MFGASFNHLILSYIIIQNFVILTGWNILKRPQRNTSQELFANWCLCFRAFLPTKKIMSLLNWLLFDKGKAYYKRMTQGNLPQKMTKRSFIHNNLINDCWQIPPIWMIVTVGDVTWWCWFFLVGNNKLQVLLENK